MESTQPSSEPKLPPPSTPSGPPSKASRVFAAVGVVLGGIYLLNPTAGLFELIPDNFPIIGNLDEAAATALVIYGLQHFGRKLKP